MNLLNIKKEKIIRPYEPQALPKEEYKSEHSVLDENRRPFPYAPIKLKKEI